MKKVNQLILAIIVIFGLLAIILLIVGVATKNWISVNGNTNELQKKFDQLTDPNGTFIITLSTVLPTQAQPFIVFIANQTLIQVEKQLSANLRSTTYSLFDKEILDTKATKVDEFQLPQGLIIAGLVCLFVGSVLAVIMTILAFGKNRVVRTIPLVFLVLGSILILLGYLLFTKIIVEDFGHELGIKAHLGASFVLVVLSSIIGFITAVIFGSTKILYRDRSDSEFRDAPVVAVDQVTLKNRAPVTMRATENRKKSNNDDDGQF